MADSIVMANSFIVITIRKVNFIFPEDLNKHSLLLTVLCTLRPN